MVKAKSRAIGVDNTVYNSRYRILFLDIDRKLDKTELHKLRDYIIRKCGNFLFLETKKGHHVVSFKLLSPLCWKRMLIHLSDYADPQFVDFSLTHGYSVLRISDKFSMYDNRPTNNRIKMIEWVEVFDYPASAGHCELFKSLHNIIFTKAQYKEKTEIVRLHFYISGGE